MDDFVTSVNWVDIFALILLLRISYTSSRVGVGKQILPLILLVFILIITLYAYKGIGNFLTLNFRMAGSFARFYGYSLVLLSLFLIYHLVAKLIKFFLIPGEDAAGGIEKTFGLIMGLMRSFIIIALVIMGFLLTPVRYIENSVKSSYSASFFININLRFYSFAVNTIFQSEETSVHAETRELLRKKKKYFFRPFDLEKKSRFFSEEF